MESTPLPPWDQIPYFDTPTITTVTGGAMAASVTQIVAADPRRVALIISLTATGANVLVSPSPTVAIGHDGILLQQNFPFLEITQAEYGSLVNVAWYAFIDNLTNVSVTQVLLNEWPVRRRRRHAKAIEGSEDSDPGDDG